MNNSEKQISRSRPDNFTGVWKALWPNGNLRYFGHFVDGMEVGQHVSYWEDGTVAQISWRNANGVPRGTSMSFYPDGDKECEETWDDESRHPGTFTRRCFDSEGDIYLTSRYVEFEQVDSSAICGQHDADEAAIDNIVGDVVSELRRQIDDESEAED